MRDLRPQAGLGSRRRRAGFSRGVLSLILALPTFAGNVHTLDGQTLEGNLYIQKNQLLFSPKGGKPEPINLDNILSASFVNPAPKPLPVRLPRPQRLDPRWRTQDVGPTGTPGSVAVIDDKYSVGGAGANIKGAADSFYFVYQELRGDGQIVARLSDLQLVNPDEKAGIMIREKFNERGSKCAFLYFKPQAGSSFAWRAEADAEMTGTPAASEDRPPAWLKLTRQRGVITAYKSLDGESWVRVGMPIDLPMDQRVYAGLAVCSRDTNAACVATFQQPFVQPAIVNDDPPPKLRGQPDPNLGWVNRAVVMRSGATLTDAYIQSADDQSVQLVRGGKQVSLATSDVARLILVPTNQKQMSKIPPAGSGVLLARGDFIEGDFQSLKANRVKINSIVFGPSDLAVGSEAVVIVLHDINPAGSQAQWVVRTTNGLTYMAKSLKIDRNMFLLEDELAGNTYLPSGAILELKLGGARFDSLADLRPDRIDVPAGASTASAYSTPDTVSLAGRVIDHAMIVTSNTSLQYSVGGRYKDFVVHVGVADGVAPLVAVRVVASVDGKEIAHTPPLTSFDEPATLAVPLSGGANLTLRVEALGDPNLPASATMADGMFVK